MNKGIFIYLLIIKCLMIYNSKTKLVLEVKGNSDYLNFYYIDLSLGSKKQKQIFILDTTSSIISSPCTLCESCGEHLNDYYTVNSFNSAIKTNSYESKFVPNLIKNNTNLPIKKLDKNNCYFLSKQENEEIFGIYLNDILSFKTINLKENNVLLRQEYEFILPIGCSLKEKGYYMTSVADGIFGLNNNIKSFVSMLYMKGIIHKNLFTLCFDKNGGYFSLGDIETDHHICSKISYIDYNPSSELYILDIDSIFIEDYEISVQNNSTLNSASTISYFPENIFNEIAIGIFLKCAESEGKCGDIKKEEGYGICMDFDNMSNIIDTDDIIDALPLIKIKFKNYEFNWEPKNYLLNFTSKNKIRTCFGIDTEKNLKNIILGTNFFHGYDIIFDRNEHKIGFCEAFCGGYFNENITINDTNNVSEIKILTRPKPESNRFHPLFFPIIFSFLILILILINNIFRKRKIFNNNNSIISEKNIPLKEINDNNDSSEKKELIIKNDNIINN